MQNKWLEIPLLAFLLIVPSYTIRKRFNMKQADGNPVGLGQRAISLIALLILVPVISVLAVENILAKDALATLLGTIVGYTLGSLTKES